MNRFRKAGYIEYNGQIKVNSSLLNVLLHEGDHSANGSKNGEETVQPKKIVSKPAKARNRATVLK